MRPSLDLDQLRETVHFDKTIPIRPYWNIEPVHYSIHWQPNIEIIVPVENHYTVTVEGNVIDLQPGELLLISPGSLHSIHAPKQGSRYILQVLPQLFSHIPQLEKLASCFYPYVLFDSGTDPAVLQRMNEIIWRVYEVYYGSTQLQLPQTYSYILELLILIIRNQPLRPAGLTEIPSLSSYKYTDRFLDLCDYIRDNCSQTLDIHELADTCGFSESHFLRLFKKYTNMSLSEYINHCRISYAKELLALNPHQNITEISMQTGFGSLATFNRLFKSMVGCTPSHFRERLALEVDNLTLDTASLEETAYD